MRIHIYPNAYFFAFRANVSQFKSKNQRTHLNSYIIAYYKNFLDINATLLGNLVVLAGVISFSLYITIFKNLISKYSPITSMKWLFLFGTLQSFPFCQNALFETNFSMIDNLVWLKIGYTIVFATFTGYILIAIGQKNLRPTTLSMYNYLQPIVAAIVAVTIGMDHFGFDKIISAVLVFSGVYIVTQSKSRAQLEAEKTGIPVNKDQVGN